MFDCSIYTVYSLNEDKILLCGHMSKDRGGKLYMDALMFSHGCILNHMGWEREKSYSVSHDIIDIFSLFLSLYLEKMLCKISNFSHAP